MNKMAEISEHLTQYACESPWIKVPWLFDLTSAMIVYGGKINKLPPQPTSVKKKMHQIGYYLKTNAWNNKSNQTQYPMMV